MRWLHIYLSMIGFSILLFFSVTGITLNHPHWFSSGQERQTSASGTLNVAWIEPRSDGRDLDRLEIVEFLRATHHLGGAVSAFTVDEQQCVIAFKGPGYMADIFIDRQSGEYEATQTFLGAVAIINDLHKGRDSGTAWSWLIDISAILMTLISVTGLVLLFYIKRRRNSGLVVAFVGTVLAFAVFLWGVP